MTPVTADGHPVVIGEVYWNNDYRQVRVTGISHDETNQNTGEVVRWFTTEHLDGQRASIFDGSRLSLRRP